MTVSNVSNTPNPIPLSQLSQPSPVAQDDFSDDDGGDVQEASPANALSGSPTAALSSQTLQTLLGLQQDPSTQNTQTPPKAHHHGHGHHGGGGGSSGDTLENILAAADDSTSTATGETDTTAGGPSDPLDPQAQNPSQTQQAPL